MFQSVGVWAHLNTTHLDLEPAPWRADQPKRSVQLQSQEVLCCCYMQQRHHHPRLPKYHQREGEGGGGAEEQEVEELDDTPKTASVTADLLRCGAARAE